MKKIILIISLIASFNSAFAQVPDNGTVNPNPNLDKFVGTWKGNDGSPGTEVTLMLKKVMYHFTGTFDYYQEVLIGCHRYIENGVIIEDNLSLFPSLNASSTNLPLIMFEWGNSNTVFGTIKDITKDKFEELKLIYNSATTPFINWKLHIKEGAYPVTNGQTTYDTSTTLPSTFVLALQ